MKQCSKCRILKPVSEYYRAPGGRDGHRTECKDCHRSDRRKRYARNPAAEIARVKAWQQANADHVYAKNREYRRANPDRIREGHLKRTFGITLDEFDAMLAAQGGGCAICGRPAPDGTSLHVDHDHDTGVVRGLLCFTCNGALGMFAENDDFLFRAADYASSGGFAASDAPAMVSRAQERAAALVAAGGRHTGD